jgi:hypothetical protein
MGFVSSGKPCGKGPIPFCLDEVSRGGNARTRLQQLSDAVKALPSYQDLATVLDTHLMAYVPEVASQRPKIVDHLKKNWFDELSPDAYFPGQPVAEIYAKGLLQAVEVSLKAATPVPLNTWWLIDDRTEVSMLTLADVDKKSGSTVGGRVTLLIQTPKPKGPSGHRNAIMGDLSHAWFTRKTDSGQVETDEIR